MGSIKTATAGQIRQVAALAIFFSAGMPAAGSDDSARAGDGHARLTPRAETSQLVPSS